MTEEKLLNEGYRKYDGETVDIYYSKNRCQHVGECIRGNTEVFDVERRPWIISTAEHHDSIIKTIKKCPTKALKYKLADSDEILP